MADTSGTLPMAFQNKFEALASYIGRAEFDGTREGTIEQAKRHALSLGFPDVSDLDAKSVFFAELCGDYLAVDCQMLPDDVVALFAQYVEEGEPDEFVIERSTENDLIAGFDAEYDLAGDFDRFIEINQDGEPTTPEAVILHFYDWWLAVSRYSYHLAEAEDEPGGAPMMEAADEFVRRWKDDKDKRDSAGNN